MSVKTVTIDFDHLRESVFKDALTEFALDDGKCGSCRVPLDVIRYTARVGDVSRYVCSECSERIWGPEA